MSDQKGTGSLGKNFDNSALTVGAHVLQFLHREISDPKSTKTYTGFLLDSIPDKEGLDVSAVMGKLVEGNLLGFAMDAVNTLGIKPSTLIGVGRDGKLNDYEAVVLAAEIGNARFSSLKVTPEVHAELAHVISALEKNEKVKLSAEDKLGLERFETAMRDSIGKTFGSNIVLEGQQPRQNIIPEGTKPIQDPFTPRFAGN